MVYSIDFRRCVLENLEGGMTWEEVVTVFKISRYTLSRWIKLNKEKGSLKYNQRAPYKMRQAPESRSRLCLVILREKSS